MVAVEALGMVGQNLDHPAVADFPAPALFDHALELAFKRGQRGDAKFYVPKMNTGNPVRCFARLV